MNVIEPISQSELLDYIPQKVPFRFVDEILEVQETRIVGRYQFLPTEFFYIGHFPGNPITPGVILLESMAQVGAVALGIYLLSKEISRAELNQYVSLLSDGTVELLS